VTLSEEHAAASEGGDRGGRLSIVHTDADRGPSSTSSTLVPIGSPPPPGPRFSGEGGPDRADGGTPWAGGPWRPSDRRTIEELKATLRDGPQSAFRGPSTSYLQGMRENQRSVFTTFKPHVGGAARRSLPPGDSSAPQQPSSAFRADASIHRPPGGQRPPRGGWDSWEEAGSSQTGTQFDI